MGKLNGDYDQFQRFRDQLEQDDYSESKGFETLWTVAEVSNEGENSDSIDQDDVEGDHLETKALKMNNTV